MLVICVIFFFSSRRRHTRYWRDWSSDVCSSDLSRWSRCPYERCALLCPSSSRPRDIEGSRRPCQYGACWGVSSVDHDEVCERSEERRVGKECRSRWSPYH